MRIGRPTNSPATPTYRTVAAVLEGETGSGLGLLGWTVARMVLIVPGLLIVGVDAKRALYGGAVASGIISGFTYFRIKTAGDSLGLR